MTCITMIQACATFRFCNRSNDLAKSHALQIFGQPMTIVGMIQIVNVKITHNNGLTILQVRLQAVETQLREEVLKARDTNPAAVSLVEELKRNKYELENQLVKLQLSDITTRL